jgi:hypothetical protein
LKKKDEEIGKLRNHNKITIGGSQETKIRKEAWSKS